MANKKPRGDTQEKILLYIESVIRTRGYAPSVREIGEAVGLRSTSTVHGHLTRLEKKGLLRRDAMKPRAMGLAGDAAQMDAAQSDTRYVPVVGHVAAGSPILAEENTESVLPLPADLVGEGEHFILRVHGDSMINAGIMDGDYVVVRQQNTAVNGEIIVALIDGNATVKRFYRENGRFRLQPENPAMAPIYARAIDIAGKVVSVYRLY